MAVRLFVGNLPYETSEAEIREHFASVGELSQVFLPVDRDTGRPRGFAFVEFADAAMAEEAIRRLNSQPFKGRMLAVNEARARESRPPVGSAPPRRFEPRADFVPGVADRPREGNAGRRGGWSDNKPARGRGQSARGNRTERPKGPIRERTRGQLFTTDDVGDYDGPEPDIDNFATRAPEQTPEDEE